MLGLVPAFMARPVATFPAAPITFRVPAGVCHAISVPPVVSPATAGLGRQAAGAPPPSTVIVVADRTSQLIQVSVSSGSDYTAESGREHGVSGDEPRVVRPRGWAKAVTDVLSPAHFVIVLPPVIGW